jgi:hypothetical protein
MGWEWCESVAGEQFFDADARGINATLGEVDTGG